MRKYLGYVIFALVILLVVGLAVSHSSHMRSLVNTMANGEPEQRKAAVSELITAEQFGDAITGEPTETRRRVTQALTVVGTPDAVKQALPLLKDTEKVVRDEATATLQKIGANSADTMKEMVNGLKDGDANIRKGTIAALTAPNGGIGPNPKSGVDVVAAVVDIMKREAGARGPGGDVLSSDLFRKNGANAKSVPALFTLLGDKDDGVKQGAADALGKIGDPVAVAPLTALTQTGSADSRRVAIGAIALIADKSGEAILTQAIANTGDDNEARAQAAAGLGKIGGATAVNTLIKTLDDSDLKLRSAAVAALARAARPAGETGSAPANTMVLQALLSALRTPDENARLGAAQALQAIQSPDANDGLFAVLATDANPNVQTAAAVALGYAGNQAAVGPLIKALSAPSGDVNKAAASALAAIGPAATDALIGITQTGGPDAYYAASALGAQDKSVLPALQKAAVSVNPTAQRWAAVALGLLTERGVSEARPILQQLASSKDPDVSFVAQQQINRVGQM